MKNESKDFICQNEMVQVIISLCEGRPPADIIKEHRTLSYLQLKDITKDNFSIILAGGHFCHDYQSWSEFREFILANSGKLWPHLKGGR